MDENEDFLLKEIRSQLFRDIEAERASQDEQHGGILHDQGHRGNDWIAFIVRQLGKAHDEWEADHFNGYRQRMVKVAALAVAAIEAVES